MRQHSIQALFANLQERGEKAFIPYMTAGFPNIQKSEQIAKTLIAEGADLLEVGFPFSDPVADGPVIQKTSYQALTRGMNIKQGLSLVEKLSSRIAVLPMTYCNLVYAYGIKTFARDLQQAGAAGIILADLTVEGCTLFQPIFQERGLHLIFFASTTTPTLRLKDILEKASGFLYCISRPGTTGERSTLYRGIIPFLRKVRRLAQLPLCVGFGISNARHIRKLYPYANGFIAGSAVLNPFLEAPFPRALSKMGKLVRTMKKATYG